MRLRAAALATALAASLALPAGAVSVPAGMPAPAAPAVPQGDHSPNLPAVASLLHRTGSLQGAATGGGSDIEFATLDVTGLPGAPEGHGVRDFALAGTLGKGLQIVDVTDPVAPVTAAVYDCRAEQGDVQVFTRDDGKTYITYTADYSAVKTSQCYKEAKALGQFATSDLGLGTFIADITNPYAPRTVSFVPITLGSHNMTVHPSGKYLYNSNSELVVALDAPAETKGIGQLEYFSIEDVTKPVKLGTLLMPSGIDSHDITFSADGKRAYVAAITHTLIIDTTNPAQPTILTRFIDPSINIVHQSDPVTLTDATLGMTRTFLVLTDEFAGAAGNGFCPGGGLHVYDITGPLEMAPVKVGFWAIPAVRDAGVNSGDALTCTSHVLRMHPESKVMTIAWYNAGVRVVDLSGLVGVSVGIDQGDGNVGVGMKEIAYHTFSNSDTWAAKTNRIAPDGSFYLFGNDMNRGLDVYRFTRTAPPSPNPGTWLTPAQALARATAFGVRPGGQLAGYCLLRARA